MCRSGRGRSPGTPTKATCSGTPRSTCCPSIPSRGQKPRGRCCCTATTPCRRREKARRLGYAGALFAWESADSGEEATPAVVVTPEGEVVRILTGEQEHHISADVAYAVWQYWQATADDDFLREAGAEIVLETARFWASRGQVEADGRYHIRRVIGPDEYHEGVDDNAYTNGMAQWNLERGAEAARILRERWPERWKDLAERLDLSQEEIRRWPELARACTSVGIRQPGSSSSSKATSAWRKSTSTRTPDGRCPWTCCWGGAHPALAGSQAGRRGAAAVPAVGPLPAAGAGRQLPLLRATDRTWQFAQPGHPRVDGRPPGRHGARPTLLPAGGRN